MGIGRAAGMSGKRAARSAPRGPAVSGAVHLSCSDLPELLVAGLFDGIKRCPPRNAKEQKCNANKIAAYRLLNSEFRSLVDARILKEFTAFRDCAYELFEATYQVSKHEKQQQGQPAAYESQLKSLKEKKRDCAQQLLVCGKAFFPRAYAESYVLNLSNRSPLAHDLLFLLMSVANFMSIARERCYAHCCSGFKHCTNSATPFMAELHTSISSKVDDRTWWHGVVYCKRECFGRMCVSSSCMRHATTGESKVAKEMFRLKGVCENEGDDVYKATWHGTYTVKNPTIVVNISGMPYVDSLQKRLGLDAGDVLKCRSELRRKEAQADERRKLVLDIERKFMLDDVDAAFRFRKDLCFDGLESAEGFFPLTVDAIRVAICDVQLSHLKASCNGVDIRTVNSCLNQIAALAGPVRKADRELYKDSTASKEAYDFMAGHCYPKIVPCMAGAADMLNTKASEHDLLGKTKFDAGQICRALHLFDECRHFTMKAENGLVVVGSASRPAWHTIPAVKLGNDYEAKKISVSVQSILEGCDTPPNLTERDLQAISVGAMIDAFNTANGNAKTRPLALAIISVFPRDLCKRASEE